LLKEMKKEINRKSIKTFFIGNVAKPVIKKTGCFT